MRWWAFFRDTVDHEWQPDVLSVSLEDQREWVAAREILNDVLSASPGDQAAERFGVVSVLEK
jgi:hypothetical protein